MKHRSAIIAMVIAVTSACFAAPATAANVEYTLYSTEQRAHLAYIANDQWVDRGIVQFKQPIEQAWWARWSAQGRSWAINASTSNYNDGAWIRCEVRVNGRLVSEDTDLGTTAQVQCG
ncbi:hypothetical protein [Gordonia amicalis]|uniref:hypothetical protein n=1 Tax=Gordonia amicalis TaxID=89053 RepID=UPI000464ACFA|nr:hypothetical protein [Gordonia amicalis]